MRVAHASWEWVREWAVSGGGVIGEQLKAPLDVDSAANRPIELASQSPIHVDVSTHREQYVDFRRGVLMINALRTRVVYALAHYNRSRTHPFIAS